MFVPMRLITELHFVATNSQQPTLFCAGEVMSPLWSPDVTNDCQRRPIGRVG
jgi:hypothetical protein